MKTVFALVRKAIAFELALYRSLSRWVTRRPHVPYDATPYRYLSPVEALLWVFVAVSAVELFVLHVILPWATIRVIADILGVWGLVWMLGLLASFKVYPHLVSPAGLRIRNGAGTDISVGWDAVDSVTVRERGRDRSRAVQLDRDGGNVVLNVVVGKRTNIDVTFRRPIVVPLGQGAESITELRLFADDARQLVNRAREHLRAVDQTHR